MTDAGRPREDEDVRLHCREAWQATENDVERVVRAVCEGFYKTRMLPRDKTEKAGHFTPITEAAPISDLPIDLHELHCPNSNYKLPAG
jgi:hypothetical protein